MGAAQNFTHPKVAKFQKPSAADEDVLRLYITVEDLPIVNVLERQAYLHCPVQDSVLGQRLPVSLDQHGMQVPCSEVFLI